MHKNAIKIVGGVKFSKKIPQNVGGQKSGIFRDKGGIFAIQDLATLIKTIKKKTTTLLKAKKLKPLVKTQSV